ncbi:MAG: hypothetical protein A3K60_01380 [Euryarchaeota archaeon RBG_19FT_COMBO_56_21]|nr:MAG: hypothetical protein A3K60_01380 [Euryarchaeota archaeon RBG_19FT_COMBO_56_21]
MRIKAKLVFRPETLDRLRTVFDNLGIEIEEKIDGIAFLFIDDERYARLKDELSRMGIKPFELREKVFSEKELNSAEFLYMGPAGYWGYPQPEERMEDWQRASYDLSTACPLCGFGAVQNIPYLVKREPKFGRNDILALNWTYEFLVTERLRRLIEDASLTGVEFWPLLRYKRKELIQGYYQLFVTNRLPPMSPNTEIVDLKLPEAGPKRCSCGRFGRNRALDSVYGVAVPIRYKRGSLKDAKDFNLTSEWLGLYDARPKRIVSHRVYQLFSAHSIKRVTFEPVIVED